MKRTTMLSKTGTLFFSLAYLCAIAQLPLSSCEEEPAIKEISNEQIKEIGQEAEFNCTVVNARDYPVLWIKLDKYRSDRVTLTHGLGLILKGDKFNVTYHNATSTYSLKIKNLVESDTGFYECQILIAVEKKISRETSLQIRRAPTISLNVTRIANATEGEPFELYCTADGFPVPRISWKRENDDLLSFGGVIHQSSLLRIQKAHRDDRGIYTCVAENGVGPQDQVNATVYVQFKPVTTAVRPRVGQARGYLAQLECKVEAYPPPVITWYKNGTRVGTNDFTNKEKPNHEYIGTYTISSANDESYGEYYCDSHNIIGSSKARLQLFESIIPACVISC